MSIMPSDTVDDLHLCDFSHQWGTDAVTKTIKTLFLSDHIE